MNTKSSATRSIFMALIAASIIIFHFQTLSSQADIREGQITIPAETGVKGSTTVIPGLPFSYRLQQSASAPDLNSDWDKAFWKTAFPAELKHYMGEKPSHFPETRVRLSYDNSYLYVIFHVNDRYVKAVEKKRNGKVWHDSCVELFFSPGPDVKRGYFNFEVTCKGVYLFEYHAGEGAASGFVDKKDCRDIRVAHSLRKNVRQEIAEPVSWTVEYRIPIGILEKYMDVERPGPGTVWRANFYKCADKTSHPHWLTWAPVEHPEPKFHLPEFFGRLEFN